MLTAARAGLPFFFGQIMKFHPAAQILTWCLLVVAMQALTLNPLMIVSGLILLCTLLVSGRKFMQLIRRTRWIMLSLLLVYAYSTPGQALVDTLGILSPSREGVADGVLQMTRLLTALAGLAILLERLHRHKLIAGLYTLLAPLQLLGLSRERFAVRLALTLHYAEVAMLRAGQRSWQDTLNGLFRQHGLTEGQSTEDRMMELPLYRFALCDALLLAAALLLLWLASVP